MNEYIIYDEENYFGEDNRFYTHEEMCQRVHDVIVDQNGKIIYRDLVEDTYGGATIVDIKTKEFPYITKQDVDNKKIYADCSIVEFDVLINGYRQKAYTKTLKGSFEFNDEDLRYEINIYDDPDYICIWYDSIDMSNFKIIDSIQENKLGLIKESK